MYLSEPHPYYPTGSYCWWGRISLFGTAPHLLRDFRSRLQGVGIWIALNRRSNGMTGRSVMGRGSAGFRTTEVSDFFFARGNDLLQTRSRCVP